MSDENERGPAREKSLAVSPCKSGYPTPGRDYSSLDIDAQEKHWENIRERLTSGTKPPRLGQVGNRG